MRPWRVLLAGDVPSSSNGPGEGPLLSCTAADTSNPEWQLAIEGTTSKTTWTSRRHHIQVHKLLKFMHAQVCMSLRWRRSISAHVSNCCLSLACRKCACMVAQARQHAERFSCARRAGQPAFLRLPGAAGMEGAGRKHDLVESDLIACGSAYLSFLQRQASAPLHAYWHQA